LAALTMASTSSLVMSPSTISMRWGIASLDPRMTLASSQAETGGTGTLAAAK
jgi:hypothetical protein